MKLTQLAAAMALTTASATALAATYSVTPLPVTDHSIHNFGQSIDESGQMLTITQSSLNLSVDADFLVESGFVDTYATSFENEEDVRQGIFSSADYNYIIAQLTSHSTSSRNYFLYQHIARYSSYISDSVDTELVPGLDAFSDEFNDYSFAANTYARDSLNGDYIVGSTEGPYYRIDYENEDGENTILILNDIEQTAFVEVNGETKLLPAEDETLGGLSEAFAINNNLQVVGNSAVDYISAIDDAVANCEDPEFLGDIPLAYCLRNIRVDASGDSTNYGFRLPEVGDTAFPGTYARATIWQLDAQGNVISSETFPPVYEAEADDESPYWSLANAINDQGIAVGASSINERQNVRRPQGSSYYNYERTNVAVSYANGETTEMLPREDNLQSEALAINNDNWVTGYVLRAPNSTARNRIFIHNLDSGETLYPQGFFNNAGAEGKAINNNNIVVGVSEFDSTVDTNRETHGFMFDIASGELTDLNDLLPCDSVYTIVDAVDINDSNEIIANARYRTAERYANGEEVINDEGETEMVDVIVAVKLTPLGAEVTDSCDGDNSDDDTGYERQGAAVSPFWMLLTAGLLAFRRRKNKA